MFIYGCATKPEAPKAALTGNQVVRNLTEYTLSVTRIGVPLTTHGRERGGVGERSYPIVYVSPYQTITLTNEDPGIVIGFFADPQGRTVVGWRCDDSTLRRPLPGRPNPHRNGPCQSYNRLQRIVCARPEGKSAWEQKRCYKCAVAASAKTPAAFGAHDGAQRSDALLPC
jgi:hypothetical protein